MSINVPDMIRPIADILSASHYASHSGTVHNSLWVNPSQWRPHPWSWDSHPLWSDMTSKLYHSTKGITHKCRNFGDYEYLYKAKTTDNLDLYQYMYATRCFTYIEVWFVFLDSAMKNPEKKITAWFVLFFFNSYHTLLSWLCAVLSIVHQVGVLTQIGRNLQSS